MDSIYDKVQEIHHLMDYMPHEDKYGLYPTNIIFSCHKITDVYQTCSIARVNLHYMDSEDFGELAKDDISKLFVNTMFLQNALLYYNFSIDLSWQIIWLYYDPFINNKMPNSKLFEECIKECDYENLRLRLTLARDIKLRKYYLEPFFNNPTVKEIRELYNFIKHRGTVHFPGLGLNDTKMAFSINEYCAPLVSRRTIDIKELKEKLIEFDKLFVKYLLDVINILIPDNYLNQSSTLDSIVNYYFKYKDQLEGEHNNDA